MRWLIAIVLVVLAACGGDDGAPIADARVPDAAIDAWSPDAFSCASCVAPVAVCDEPALRCEQCAGAADCAGLAFTGVCEAGACRECAGNADCGATSLGATCDTDRGYCRCAGPSDCAGNANGAVCDVALGACTCTGDGDCVGPATCQPQPYLGPGAKTCQ